MAETKKGKILVLTWVWDKPDGNQIGTVDPETVVDVYTEQSNWVKIDKGWIKRKTKSGEICIELITNSGETQYANSIPVPTEQSEEPETGSVYGDSSEIDYSQYSIINNNNSNSLAKKFLKSMDGVFGLPYQWMDSVDPKLPESKFGALYTDMIISRMPLLLLSPGKPVFMEEFKNKQKSDVLTLMMDGIDNSIDDLLDLNQTGKYYSFAYDYKEYFKYVNPMCQSAAQFLGIGEYRLNGKQLKDFKWQDYSNSALRNFISSNESIAFYIESQNQVSESFSNNTGESALASKVNEISDLSNEIQFLLGGMAGINFEKMKEAASATKSELQSFNDKYLNNPASNLLTNLVDAGLTTVMCGGKMIFPEIWKDSEYSNDYDVTVKLRSPDKDPISLYFNLLVPMMMLVGLTACRSLGPNAYKAPFLVKGFYKGIINCQMGIITSMSITKGDKGSWTVGGLPTEIDINFTIKDLYKTLTLTKTTEGVFSMDFVKNTYLVDWIANSCGININKPDVVRTLELWSNMVSNNIYNKVTFDGFSSVSQGLSNLVSGFFKR